MPIIHTTIYGGRRQAALLHGAIKMNANSSLISVAAATVLVLFATVSCASSPAGATGATNTVNTAASGDMPLVAPDVHPALAAGPARSAAPLLDPSVTPGVFDRALGVEVLADGSWLVTDGGGAWRFDDTGSEVLIVSPEGRITWRFGDGLRFAHSAIQLKNTNILIPDTNNNRLVEVSLAGKVVWTSEAWDGGTGKLSDGSHLDYPNHIQELEDGRWLLSDRDNNRVIELDRAGTVYWNYAQTKRQHAPLYIGPGPDGVGRYLVSDSEGNRVLEFDRNGAVVWEYTEGLKWPRAIEKLENGNYLITDSNGHRIIEVSPDKKIVKELKGIFSTPYEAHRLLNGNTLVCDAQNARVVEVTGDCVIVREFSNLHYPEFSREIRDPGFEKAPAGIAVDLPSGVENRPFDLNFWQVSDMSGHGTGQWAVLEDGSREGVHCAYIRSDKADASTRAWSQRVSVKPGERLNLFVSVKTKTGRDGLAGFTVAWMNATGGQIGGVTSPSISGEQDWTTIPLAVLAPPGAASARINLSLIGKGEAWFDQVELGRE